MIQPRAIRLSRYISSTALISLGIYYVCHLLFFSWSNSLCFNGNTGRVAGNQSLNAGSLRRILHSELSLDLLRPFSSLEVLASLIILNLSLLSIFIYLFTSNSISIFFQKTFLFWWVAISITMVSLIECNFSCELIINHKNIQNSYNQSLSGTYPTSIKTTHFSDSRILELQGDLGESTCRAFILSYTHGVGNIAENWFRSGGSATMAEENIFQIVSSQYRLSQISELYISVYPFSDNNKNNSNTKIYSVIGCLIWPYPWYNQLS